jgi:chromosomal replication initiator protein
MESWQQFLSQLEQELGPHVVKEWMPKLVRFDAANIYLEPRDSFQVNWFEEHARPLLKNLKNNNHRPIKVHLLSHKKASVVKEEVKELLFSQDPIESEMTLENFIPSEENLVAYKLLSENAPFNPIYLYGPSGSGKTHLLMAAAQKLQLNGKKVFFIKAETFTEHVVQAIRLAKMQNFRKVYRDIDVLIVDDIHIFSRKNATQEEFFHTFNTLHTMGRLILLSSNVAPNQLSEIEPRLISRFEWGLSLSLKKGDMRPILEKKAALWKMSLEPKVIDFLLHTFPQNPMIALQALALRAKNGPIHCLLAERLLKDLILKEKENALTFEKVIKGVSMHYGVTSEDLLGKSQMREYVLPRQVAMYFCREKLKMPFQKIGDLFSRDHSTVMSSIRIVQKGIEENKIEAIAKITSSLSH